MEKPALTPVPFGDLTCPMREQHLDFATRLTTAESEIEHLRERITEYDIAGLKVVVEELRRDIAVLRTKLWFWQMGATAAGGLIVILLERALR